MLACEKKLNSGFQIPHTISYTNSRSISAWHVFDSRPLPICSTTDDATAKMDLVQLKPELNTASSHHICLQVKNRHGSCHKARVIDINTLKKWETRCDNMQYAIYFPVRPCDKYSKGKDTAYGKSPVAKEAMYVSGSQMDDITTNLFLTIL